VKKGTKNAVRKGKEGSTGVKNRQRGNWEKTGREIFSHINR